MSSLEKTQFMWIVVLLIDCLKYIFIVCQEEKTEELYIAHLFPIRNGVKYPPTPDYNSKRVGITFVAAGNRK